MYECVPWSWVIFLPVNGNRFVAEILKYSYILLLFKLYFLFEHDDFSHLPISCKNLYTVCPLSGTAICLYRTLPFANPTRYLFLVHFSGRGDNILHTTPHMLRDSNPLDVWF